MTPIPAAPKRFVAALNYFRMHTTTKQTIINTNNNNHLVRHHQHLHLKSLSTTTSFLPNRVVAKALFSTSPHFDVASSSQHVSDVGPRYVSKTVLTSSPSSPTPVQLVVDEFMGPRKENWWTGKAPNQATLFPDQEAHSLPFLNLKSGECTRESLQAYFDNTWTLTESLFASLQGEEAFMVPPLHHLRHPLIFYYGHPAALYINKLRVAGLLKNSIDSYLEVIFETGVDEMSWDDMSKNSMAWPSVNTVKEYRRKVYETVTQLIANMSDHDVNNINEKSPYWSLVLSLEHERIHIETSAVLMNELPLKYVKFPKGFLPSYFPLQTNTPQQPQPNIDYPINKFIPVAAQHVTLGKPRDHPSFGWDNEYGQRSFILPAFTATQYKITNGEFLEFVQEQGYSRREFWTEEGWEWKAFRNAKWPTFWQNTGPQGLHHFQLRLLFDVVEMQWNWPVYVNYHESQAFAAWKSKKTGKTLRMMTELEHNAIRDNNKHHQQQQQQQHQQGVSATATAVVVDPVMEQPRDESLSASKGINSNLSYSSSSPVNFFPPNQHGFFDVFGNAWEWNLDNFSPLQSFEVHPYYEDFSTPCFDGYHNIINSNSFISTGNLASCYSRYHFRKHFLQFASFRLVEQFPVDETIQTTLLQQVAATTTTTTGVVPTTTTGMEVLTSDTDSPGPYVGAYPFRMSLQQQQEKQQQQRQELKWQKKDRARILAKYFSTPSLLPSSSDNNNNNNNKNAASHLFDKIISLVNQVNNNNNNNNKFDLTNAKVIDVGCGAGSLTFQLSKVASVVVGVDHDDVVVDVAREVQQQRQLTYTLPRYGELTQTYHINIDAPTTTTTRAATTKTGGMVEFRVADPMCLPAEWANFDMVILNNNVLSNLASPNAILHRCYGARGLVKPGGLLLLLTTLQWKENCTPKSLWYGGYKTTTTTTKEEVAAVVEVDGVEALKQKLQQQQEFELLDSSSLWNVWNETAVDVAGQQMQLLAFRRRFDNNN